MKVIAVPGVAIQIPVIGFGCSSLAKGGEKRALQLLEAAFDAGVRHFDVARYYGYGEAEGLLGRFVKSRRSAVTITTKFGIEPPRQTSALRLAVQAGRRIAQIVPGVRGFLQRRAQGLVRTGGFSAQDARASLETSLRELGTDYIDFFLLHEYTVSENSADELVTFLADAVKAGRIRHFGLGTGIENVLRAMQCQPALCGIIQFENSVLIRNIDKIPRGGPQQLIVTHGSLSRSYCRVSAFLKSHHELARSWSAELALDCSEEETLSALMLSFAVQSNSNGLVLFSSSDASRVSRNVKAVLEPNISASQVELFGRLVERDVMPESQNQVIGRS
jgi:D-threo-aldose 1-dehydrogenase